MAPSAEPADTTNFFARANYDENYWETYLAARPKYDSNDFYQSILDFHASHNDHTSSNTLKVAHDIGSGPGQVAAAMSPHVDQIIASDNNATHLAVAKFRNADLYEAKKLTFENVGGEQIANRYPPSSADLITVAECLPLMDVKVALENFATLLRPGGTLAIWFYGRPAFAEDEYATACDKVYGKIVTETKGKVMRKSGPAANAGWQRSMIQMASWLDDVEFPAAQWTNVERRKWNTDKFLPFADASASKGFELYRVSNIGEADKVTEKIDRGFWGEKWDVADVRRFINVNLPTVNTGQIDEEVEGWYKDLETAMGGEGVKRDIAWPVVLLLATKN